MPRVRIPNASLTARADAPILPFLAPRVFAEAPIHKAVQSRTGKSHGTHNAEKKARPRCHDISRASPCHVPAVGRVTNDSSSCWTRVRTSTVAGVLHSSSSTTTPRHGPYAGSRPSPSVRGLYIGISSFARQHMRSYATAGPSVRRVASRLPASPRRTRRRPRPVHEAPSLASRADVLASRRFRALAVERQRMRTYLARLSQLQEEALLKKGQYRSLRRRIANLVHWNVHTVDLSKVDRRQGGRLWLVRAFTALDRAVFPHIGQHTRRLRILHDPTCRTWSTTLFDGVEQEGYRRMWSNWNALKSSSRVSWWHRLLVYLLDRKPGRALSFMHVLANDPLVKSELDLAMLADALGHLSRLHVTGAYAPNKGWDADPDVNKHAFMPGFHHVFSQKLAQASDVCSQDLLHNLARLAGMADLKKNSDLLVQNRTFLGFDTLLHYANAFGEAGETHYALRCLDEMEARNTTTAWKVVVDRKRLRWTCALILRKSMQRGENYHETPGIVANFVRKGVEIDILLYNVVMHNAMEAGDYATAFKVYNALEGNNLKPDMHTFSILLHGCTFQNNPAIFGDFAAYCAEVAKEARDPWLATDYLYYLYFRHQDCSDIEHTSSILWRAYLDHFSAASLRPLISLGRPKLRGAIEAQDVSSESTLLAPSSMALYVILQMEIRSALLVGNQRVMNLFQQFRLLVSEGGSSDLVKLAEHPFIWNAFLLAFCQKQQFASASQLIKTMTETGPQPNVYTWNIFMQAFFKTGQVQAADRIFEIMRDRGVDPNQYTYGVMMRGYAKAQLVERIGDTMQHVDAEQEMDPDLLRALATVTNRKQLMIKLEQSRAEKEERKQLYAVRRAEAERKRWETPRLTSDLLDEPSTTTIEDDESLMHIEQEAGPGMEYDGMFPFLDVPSAAVNPSESLISPQQLPASSQYGKSNMHTPNKATEQPPSPPPSSSAQLVTHDPELQYRRPQEQLGTTPSTTHLHPSTSSGQLPAPIPKKAIQQDLCFKSMLPTGPSQPRPSNPVRRARARKVQTIAPKKLPTFSIRKVPHFGP